MPAPPPVVADAPGACLIGPQAGVAIAPLRYTEATAKALGRKGRKAEAEREARTKVLTVSGGVHKPGKKGAA
jgi:hypothetical protein